MKEQWKLVNEKGFDNLYLISNLGNVYSIRNKKEIKPIKIKDNYSMVVLHNNMKQKGCLVHRLVAKAFIPNPNNLPLVLHKKAINNGGTNIVDNLYWGTPLQNMEDKRNENRDFHINGGKHYMAHKINQYDLNHNFIKQWDCIASASKELKIHREQISRVCRKCPRRKSVHGFIFEYAKQ